MTVFYIGQPVLWHYETHKGWGASWWVPAIIIKIGPKRIQIAAELRNGGNKAVWTRQDKIEARNK